MSHCAVPHFSVRKKGGTKNAQRRLIAEPTLLQTVGSCGQKQASAVLSERGGQRGRLDRTELCCQVGPEAGPTLDSAWPDGQQGVRRIGLQNFIASSRGGTTYALSLSQKKRGTQPCPGNSDPTTKPSIIAFFYRLALPWTGALGKKKSLP